MFFTIILTMVMSVTGTILKFPQMQNTVLEVGFMRMIHNMLSPLFSLSLFVMTATGLVMYVFPLTRRKVVPPQQQS